MIAILSLLRYSTAEVLSDSTDVLVISVGAWLNMNLGVVYCTVMVAIVLLWLIVKLIYIHFLHI